MNEISFIILTILFGSIFFILTFIVHFTFEKDKHDGYLIIDYTKEKPIGILDLKSKTEYLKNNEELKIIVKIIPNDVSCKNFLYNRN